MRVVKKPEERRAEMIAAAAKLFARQGFVKTTVAEIVEAVGVAKGLFYYYFTTKDDMVKAVVEEYCRYLGGITEMIADSEGSASEKYDRLIENESWKQCFTAPMINDLCIPQNTALYADMCDRLYQHMRTGLERITAQALREQGADEHEAPRIVGVGLYGILMMARNGGMSVESTGGMIEKLTAVVPKTRLRLVREESRAV